MANPYCYTSNKFQRVNKVTASAVQLVKSGCFTCQHKCPINHDTREIRVGMFATLFLVVVKEK